MIARPLLLSGPRALVHASSRPAYVTPRNADCVFVCLAGCNAPCVFDSAAASAPIVSDRRNVRDGAEGGEYMVVGSCLSVLVFIWLSFLPHRVQAVLAGDAGPITGCFFIRTVTSSGCCVFLYERDPRATGAVIRPDYVATLDILTGLLQRVPRRTMLAVHHCFVTVRVNPNRAKIRSDRRSLCVISRHKYCREMCRSKAASASVEY